MGPIFIAAKARPGPFFGQAQNNEKAWPGARRCHEIFHMTLRERLLGPICREAHYFARQKRNLENSSRRLGLNKKTNAAGASASRKFALS